MPTILFRYIIKKKTTDRFLSHDSTLNINPKETIKDRDKEINHKREKKGKNRIREKFLKTFSFS